MRSSAAQANAEALQEDLGERLRFRLLAERLHDSNAALAGLLPAYTQLEVVSEFTSLTAGLDYELLEWEYNEGGLRVLLHNPQLDSREIIQRLESGYFFKQARISPGIKEGIHEIEVTLPGVRR